MESFWENFKQSSFTVQQNSSVISLFHYAWSVLKKFVGGWDKLHRWLKKEIYCAELHASIRNRSGELKDSRQTRRFMHTCACMTFVSRKGCRNNIELHV